MIFKIASGIHSTMIAATGVSAGLGRSIVFSLIVAGIAGGVAALAYKA